MEGGGAAAMEVLLHTLIDVSKKEISLIRGFKKNAHKLPNILTEIQSYLDDAEKKLMTESVKTWLKKLDDVAFDAHNVFDELKYDDISKKMKSVRGEKKEKVLPSCFPSFNHYVRRRHMARRINDIFIRFESVKDEAAKLGLHSRPVIEYALPEETDPQTLDPVFIGRENDVSNIIHKMLTAKEPLSVLPIVGMGGLGKTTLTRKVFNHEEIKTHFKKQIWVHVSRNFDAMVLLKKILANLTSGNTVGGESRVVLLEKIQEELKDKTCLIVLDDMWNEDPQMWESFVNSTKGNFVIVTTRSNEVASIVRTLDIHNLNVLSDEDCLSIIKQKVVSQGEDIPSRFESIAINIAKRCQGLPLAANVAGGLLQRTPKDQWISIAEGWLSNLQVEDNDVSKILRLSFDHLSPSLKRCFAYCSIFPKGEVIDKQQLIELWMAQGFLQIDPKKGMEVEGNKIFNFLVHNSLLQVAKQDEYANITHCSMHDLMHDLACIVSKGIYQVRCIGFDESSSNHKKSWRTLLFKGEELSHPMYMDFSHTLILMDCYPDELPSSINELIHLRYLDVSPTEISYLPDSIGDLYHLQTLRVENEMSKLPTTVQYLINLRHLHLSENTKLPPNIGSLTCLQTLEYYHVDKEEGYRIGELGKLKDLQGKLHISNLEEVQDQKDAESAHLHEKPKLFKLVLKWSDSREGETNDENVLEGLRPHPNLKRLKIREFRGTRFPSWTLDIADTLKNLMDVSLMDCDECEEIPMMGQLPHLKSLTLKGLGKVKSIISSFKVDSSCNKERNVVMFPVLKRLKLLDMPKLVEWMEIEMGENEHPLEIKVFPCLEELWIDECRELRMNPSQFSSSSHKELYPALHMCGSLIHFKIDGVDELEYLPDWFFLNNQNLSKLRIWRCHKLRELTDGLETLNSLKELDIWKCPNLKSIAYRRDGESQGLTSLEELAIVDCPNLISLPCEMLPSSAPSLQTLALRDLSSLMNLAEIIDCMPKMSSLNKLCIWNVPKLISPAPAVFPNLQVLWLKADDRDSSESAKKGVDGMLQAASPHSLTVLRLGVMDDWDSLPHSLQHLNALSTLSLFNFRIEELPEWFGNLTSLQTLFLYECKELRSVGIIRCLKKLTQLVINDCHPELKRWIGQQTDDVSHIPFIRVDGFWMDTTSS